MHKYLQSLERIHRSASRFHSPPLPQRGLLSLTLSLTRPNGWLWMATLGPCQEPQGRATPGPWWQKSSPAMMMGRRKCLSPLLSLTRLVRAVGETFRFSFLLLVLSQVRIAFSFRLRPRFRYRSQLTPLRKLTRALYIMRQPAIIPPCLLGYSSILLI